MKYWLKYPDRPGFIGPLALDEIRGRLQNGSLKWTCEAIEARGQSLAVLEQCRIWQPIETICPKDGVSLPGNGETWPPREAERSPAERALAEVRFNTAYPGVRKGIEIIEGLLLAGFGIAFIANLFPDPDREGFLLSMLALVVRFLVIYCVFYLIKHALIALLDLADIQLNGKS